jgi:hypothetical protein
VNNTQKFQLNAFIRHQKISIQQIHLFSSTVYILNVFIELFLCNYKIQYVDISFSGIQNPMHLKRVFSGMERYSLKTFKVNNSFAIWYESRYLNILYMNRSWLVVTVDVVYIHIQHKEVMLTCHMTSIMTNQPKGAVMYSA